MASQQLLDGLNEQMNREVTTFLRYMVQSAQIRGEQHERVREMYATEVQDEVGHAQYLAEQIVTLGGRPSLKPDLTPPPRAVEGMLEADAAQEKEDVINYSRLAEQAGGEGYMALKLQMEEQAADEERHGQLMCRYLGRDWS